ncbi:MAG: signal recognition particle protein Srp19, partial [Deltaproteobacteria bacterium CG07_land_8_20_14_0_80_38_7]
MDLGASIRKALNKITGKVIDEAAVKSLVKDLQRALLLGDVNVQLVYDLSKRIEKRSLSEKPDPGVSMNEHVLKIVYNELISLMGTGKKIELRPQKI